MNANKEQISEGYDMRLGDLQKYYEVCQQEGFSAAVYMAYMDGWKRRENKIRNDAKRAKSAV